MAVNVIQDVRATLDADEATINTQQTDLQSQKDTLLAQIAALQAQVAQIDAQQAQNAEGLEQIARFREVTTQLEGGQGFVVVPAAPTADPATATPLTPGITS